MKVKLLAYTPNADRLAAASAFSTVSEQGAIELIETVDDDKMRKVLKSTVGKGHHSVIEHASFTFSVEGVSRACTHQLVRHRIASYSQQSQRYVKYDNPLFIVPHTIEKNEDAKKIFDKSLENMIGDYKKLLEMGIPAEDARFLLPNATPTNIVITMNARELVHFFSLRCCYRAQWEIREMADAMLKEAKKAAPAIFENAGPSCVRLGYCPEKNSMSDHCKSVGVEKIKEEYKSLK
ncbi:MAG: FAD-dependent thymidylate synthase [Candidatus Aenigmatarchaeota archaeon]